eukprot:UN33480
MKAVRQGVKLPRVASTHRIGKTKRAPRNVYSDTQVMQNVNKLMNEGFNVCVEYIRGRYSCGYERAKRLRLKVFKTLGK